MRKYFLVSGILLLHLAVASLMAQNQVEVYRSETKQVIDGKPYYFHAVVQGQTLFSISQAYGISQEDIIKENPDLKHGLRYDQIILIPGFIPENQTQEPQTKQRFSSEKFVEHTVRPNETLYGISKQYGVSMEEILVHNPDSTADLKPRQVLRIPVKEEVKTFTHVVAPGETLFRISANFGVSVDNIFAVNPGLTTSIKPGQMIRIPQKQVPPNDKDDLQQPGLVFMTPDDKGDDVAEYSDSLCLNADLKNNYNIALFIPLYLEELDSLPEISQIDPSLKSFTFIEYYNGVLMALDSVSNTTDVEFTLHVFDVDQNMAKVREAVNSPGFSDMDLIIGPFFSQPLSYVAGYGLRNNIAVVSPLLNDNKLLRGFPNLFQVNPSFQSQLADMAQYVSRVYTDQNIILVHNNQRQAVDLIDGFKESLARGISSEMFYRDSLDLARVNGYFMNGSLVGDRRTNVMVMNDSIFEVRSGEVNPEDYFRENPLKEVVFSRQGFEGVFEALEPDRKNILITLIGGEAFLTDYLRQLNHDSTGYEMVLFGTQQWQDYQNVEVDYLQNLNVHILSPDFLDYRDAHIRRFVLRYREVFKTEPNNYAFKGIQTAWFFLNALANYGRNFPDCIHLMNSLHYENPYVFRQTLGPDGGWENEKSTLFRYDDYRKVDVRRFPGQTSDSDLNGGQ